MKKAILIYVLALTAITVLSQKWEQFYGEPDRNDIADGIIELYDKGYYIIAGYEGNGWNIKTDINGNSLYNKLLFHNLYIHRNFGGAVSDDNGNLYICGTILLEDSWPIVTKYNPCGEKVWCKVFVNDSFNDGVGWDIVINENGDVIVLVAHNSNDDVDQILLYCMNNDGELLWTKPYASKNDHPEIAVAIGYNLYQYNNNYFIDGYCYWPYPGNPGQVYLRPLFIKIDSLFNEEWILPFGVADSIVGEAYGTVPLNDSVYFGIGVRVSSATYNQNSLLMFFNENGEEIGYNQIANEDFGDNVDFNTIWNIVKENDTSFITKFYIGINDTVYHGETVIDTSGSLLKIKNRGPGNGIADLIKTSDNNFLQVTEVEENKGDKDIWMYKFDENLEPVPFDTNTYVYDSLCPGDIQSGFIDITNCLIWTNVEETPTPQEYYASLNTIPIKAYPNPVKEGSITFEFSNTEFLISPSVPSQKYVGTGSAGGKPSQLCIYNTYGEKVHEENIYQHQGESKVNIQKWQAGIYIVLVYSNGQVVGQSKFVVQ